MNFLKKYKNFISDVFLNIVGFGIYIIAQQVLLLPILAKIVNDETYSSIVLYISILNVVCNVIGGELGNVRIVTDSEYKRNDIIGDFAKILVFISPIIAVILFPIFLCLKHSIIGSVFLIITILMANIRLYSTCYYRLECKYNKVILQNLFYFLGVIISLVFFKLSKNIYVILLIPEFLSTLYALKNSDLIKMKLTKTIEFSNTVKKLSQFGIVSLLTNLMNYIDKFLVYPILGSFSVAVYYAANSMSKITSLITNPISNVILSWISKINNNNNKNKAIKVTILSNIPVLICVTIITIPLTYIALKILYSQYLAEGVKLIIPIAIISAFGAASTLTKSVLLKFSNTKKLLIIYIVYFITFIALAYNLSKSNGLLGFVSATLISRMILWIGFIILLIISKKQKMEEENEFDK